MSKISTEFTAAPWNAVSTFGVLDQHPWGTVMDRNNRIGRRERCEILKITQGQGEGVIAVDRGQLGPLRPNTILEALEESIARRNREGHIWPTFLQQFWIRRHGDGRM